MSDLGYDPVGAAFADFRLQETPMIKSPGLSSVHGRIRRRRRIQMAVAAAATAIAIVIPATGCAYISHRNATPTPIGASATVISSPGSPSATPAADTPTASGVPTQITACRAAQLTGAVTGSGSESSQPFVVIALTNTSAAGCELTGYPQITAAGYAWPTPAATGILPITVTDGAIFERSDPGPQRLELSPNASASFALGTATAYDGGAHMYSITRVEITLPGDQTTIPVIVNVAASRPASQPIPVTVTALVAGRSGPP
jgi:hypothetical protein